MLHLTPRWLKHVLTLFIAGVALAACGDDLTEPGQPEGTELGIVLNSTDRSLTVFPVDSPSAASTIGLSADGTPVSVAARDRWAVVPLGTYPYAAVVDLEQGEVAHTVPLPEGSGATGVAFASDTIAVVGNPARGTVTPVNVLRGTAGDEIDVGVWPQSVAAGDGLVYVINANLDNFSPAGPGSVSVLQASSLDPVGSVTLSGRNSGPAVPAPGGQLYVLNSGSFGAGDGSLSVVDATGLVELSHHDGFGDLPGALALRGDGMLFIGAYAYGVAVWDPAAGEFVRSPDDAVQLGDSPAVSALAFDSGGRLYVAKPGDCESPGGVLRVDGEFDVEHRIETGACPFDIAFTTRVVE